MTGKIAIVGDGDSVMVFKAAGVTAFTAHGGAAARDVLRTAAKEYQIIFLTEELALELGDWLKRFDEEPYPVILTVPSGKGETGYGMQTLKSAMERALGVDILFQKD